jgi:multidrug transporter EmrE-like cation transporter
MNLFTFGLVLFCILLNTVAQLLLKATMNHVGHFTFSWANILTIGFQVAFNPYFIVGMFCYVFSLVVWLLVLSRVEVSIAYPLTSLGYIATALIAYVMLGEDFSSIRIAGILIIIAGVYLVCRG